MDLLEETHAPYCTGLFGMHNCISKDAVNTGQDAIKPQHPPWTTTYLVEVDFIPQSLIYDK